MRYMEKNLGEKGVSAESEIAAPERSYPGKRNKQDAEGIMSGECAAVGENHRATHNFWHCLLELFIVDRNLT